jgi:hypothetical protein
MKKPTKPVRKKRSKMPQPYEGRPAKPVRAAGGKFEKGVSGNPAGRPPKHSIEFSELLAREASPHRLVRSVLNSAYKGDQRSVQVVSEALMRHSKRTAVGDAIDYDKLSLVEKLIFRALWRKGSGEVLTIEDQRILAQLQPTSAYVGPVADDVDEDGAAPADEPEPSPLPIGEDTPVEPELQAVRRGKRHDSGL